MLLENQAALKEWAVVVAALRSGRQMLLLRKGGIHERRGGFEVEHREFFIFPTYLHQRDDDLVPEFHDELTRGRNTRPPDGWISIDTYCTVEEAFEVSELAPLTSLEGAHIMSWTAVETRFFYRSRPGLHVLALRAYRLPEPVVIPNTPRYDGCVSWVELDRPLSTSGSRPVLSDAEFGYRLEAIRRTLTPASA
jgi:hypothetical protein